MTASSLADKPPEFWEAVGYDYYDGLALRQICTRHHISLGQFNLAQAELGWRRRKTKQVSRERLIRRMFALLDTSVTQVEAQMRISTTPADPKKPIPKPTATKTTREALVLNRLAMTLGKLIDLETETVAEKKPRQTRQMLDVRDRLVQRIEELKRK